MSLWITASCQECNESICANDLSVICRKCLGDAAENSVAFGVAEYIGNVGGTVFIGRSDNGVQITYKDHGYELSPIETEQLIKMLTDALR